MTTTPEQLRGLADSVSVVLGKEFSSGVAQKVARSRHRRRLATVGGPVIAAAALAAVVMVLPRSGRPVTQTVIATQPTAVSGLPSGLPSDITGTQQVLNPAKPFNVDVLGVGTGLVCYSLPAGSAHAFTVGGSPKFEVADVHKTDPCHGLPGPTDPSAGLFVLGVGGAFIGTGYDANLVPISTTGTVPVQVLANWPKAGKQLYVWSHLPTGTAFITYSYKGKTLDWEHPVSGVMAVLVPRPATFDASYKIAHAAPLPLIRAFNAQGHLLKKVNAPII